MTIDLKRFIHEQQVILPIVQGYGQRNGRVIRQNVEKYIQRFYNKIEITDSCWLWKGAINKDGYGNFRYGEKIILAHRFIWFLAYGEFPVKHVLHHCDNPPCVNVQHLFLGSQEDNIKDMASKKRGSSALGEEHHSHKLTKEQVLEIRRIYKFGDQHKLARMFGVTPRSIRKIIFRESWKHI